jgi:hypothetical protein
VPKPAVVDELLVQIVHVGVVVVILARAHSAEECLFIAVALAHILPPVAVELELLKARRSCPRSWLRFSAPGVAICSLRRGCSAGIGLHGVTAPADTKPSEAQSRCRLLVL